MPAPSRGVNTGKGNLYTVRGQLRYDENVKRITANKRPV